MSQRIKKLRKASGLTQVELATKAGITQVYVSSLESGARENPSLDILRRLAKALKTDVAELLA
jgi:XRE family transcriptional regulator, master regulator for biofilm formation